MSSKESTKKADQPEKKSRAKYVCPPDLAELIDLMNLVPMNIEMKSIKELSMDYQFSRSDSDNEIILQQFNKLIADLPADFNNYLYNLKKEILLEITEDLERTKHIRAMSAAADRSMGGSYSYLPLNYEDLDPVNLELVCNHRFITKYIEFYDLRENVRKFTEKRNDKREFVIPLRTLTFNKGLKQVRGRRRRLHTDIDNDNSLIIRKPIYSSGERFSDGTFWYGSESRNFPLQITAPILIDKNGNDYLGGFAQLIGTFDSDRLRICEICSRLFWAKRKESETCSARCFNNLRQRNYRNLTDEEKAQRKAKRESTRQSKNELKAGRERSRKKS